MSPVTVLSSVPLADRVRVAHETDSVLIFTGKTLRELHELILDAREVERAYQERSVAIAETQARMARETRVTRAWVIVAYLLAALSLAGRSGGLLP